MNQVNYQIEMPHRKKNIINLLKKWEPPLAMTACEVGEEDEDEIPNWREEASSQPTVNTQLSSSQRKELDAVMSEFKDVLHGKPRQTQVMQHSISADSTPIRQPSYRIPHAYRDEVLKELQEMEEGGINEPSSSEWLSQL